jgi:hypothetical protein
MLWCIQQCLPKKTANGTNECWSWWSVWPFSAQLRCMRLSAARQLSSTTLFRRWMSVRLFTWECSSVTSPVLATQVSIIGHCWCSDLWQTHQYHFTVFSCPRPSRTYLFQRHQWPIFFRWAMVLHLQVQSLVYHSSCELASSSCQWRSCDDGKKDELDLDCWLPHITVDNSCIRPYLDVYIWCIWCIYVYIYMMYIYNHVCIYMYIYVCIYMYVCIHVCICIYACYWSVGGWYKNLNAYIVCYACISPTHMHSPPCISPPMGGMHPFAAGAAQSLTTCPSDRSLEQNPHSQNGKRHQHIHHVGLPSWPY